VPETREADTHNEAAVPISDIKIPSGQKGYAKKEWMGTPIYICDACGADTFDEGLVIGHVERLHRK
jgi:hypothetical protein